MRFLWRSQVERGRKIRERTDKKIRRPLPARPRRSRFLLFFLWILLGGTIVYTLFLSVFLRLEPGEVHVSGVEKIPRPTVETFVREKISGTWFGILPQNSFLLFRSGALEKELAYRFPLARTVSVTKVFPHGLEIVFEERDRLVLWCAGGPCYLVTEEGKAEEAREVAVEENQKFVRTVVDTSGQSVRIGQALFSFDLPNFIGTFELLFEESLGLQRDSHYEATSRFAEELRFKTNEGFYLYISTALPPEETLSALALLFEKELPVEKRKDLEYVDARTENRLYYLLRGGEESVSSSQEGEEKKEEKD